MHCKLYLLTKFFAPVISLLSIVNLHEKDIHSEIIQIYESKLFEKFRMLTRILSNEVTDLFFFL